MGPVRAGLTAYLAMAAAASAEVCDKVRPDWVPGARETALHEALLLLLSPWALATLAAIAAAFALRKPLIAHLALALSIGLVVVTAASVYLGDAMIYAAARAEGCVGPDYLRILLAVALLALAGAALLASYRKAPT